MSVASLSGCTIRPRSAKRISTTSTSANSRDRDDQRGHQRDVRLRRRLLIRRALLQGLHDRRGGRVVGDEQRADLRVGNRVISRPDRPRAAPRTPDRRRHASRSRGAPAGRRAAPDRCRPSAHPETLASSHCPWRAVPAPRSSTFFASSALPAAISVLYAVHREARAQQVRRRIVERMNGHQIAARNAVERLARAVQRGEAERADHDRQRDQNDPDHGQRRTNRPPA